MPTPIQSHLELAHHYWKDIVSIGDIVIDATCGNGQDSLALCKLALTPGRGTLFALDIQPSAISNTQKLLSENLPDELIKRVIFVEGSHQIFPNDIKEASVKLIVYNLGYLPRGDKTLTTQTSSTLASMMAAQNLLIKGGVISFTCYPGHAEGANEETALLASCQQLPSHLWNCCHHRWINRPKAPSLLLLQKRS